MKDLQQQLTDLQEQRAALLAEQEELATRVPQLEAAWKAMPSTYNQFGNKISTPEQWKAMEESSAAASRLYNLPRLIETIEQEIAYVEKVANAESDIARHNAETQAAEVLAASLEQQLGQLTARLESLRNEIQHAQAEAEKDQQEAAQAIARAAASGDGKAEKAAQAKLGQAVEAARLVGEKTRTGQIVIDALTREATALEERLSAARQQAESARLAALRATTTRLQAEWNAVAEELSVLGAQLIETTRAMGSPYHGLAKLLIPTFGPRPSHINEHSLRRHAAGDEAA
jgi:hypothetical protein